MTLGSSLCWGHRLSASEMLKNIKELLSAGLFGLPICARSFGLNWGSGLNMDPKRDPKPAPTECH